MAKKLDKTDIAILEILQDSGRITNAELANAVYLSASPCLQRVKKLEKSGVIKGYEAHIDVSAVTSKITVFTHVTLSGINKEHDFFVYLRKLDELRECYNISGGFYLLKFVAANFETYEEIVERMEATEELGISSLSSFIVMRAPIQKRGLPIKALFKDD